MTNEEAIDILSYIKTKLDDSASYAEHDVALDMAIRALEQQPCDDCISRTEALKAIEKEKQGWEGVIRYAINYAIDECHSRIAELPPVTPQVESEDEAIKALEVHPNRCDSCIHSEEQDGSNCYECDKGMADNFEAQPCEDCISRADVLELTKKGVLVSNNNYQAVCKAINELPSVTSQSPKGKWIDILDEKTENTETHHDECSNCGYHGWTEYSYCPNCGSDNRDLESLGESFADGYEDGLEAKDE